MEEKTALTSRYLDNEKKTHVFPSWQPLEELEAATYVCLCVYVCICIKHFSNERKAKVTVQGELLGLDRLNKVGRTWLGRKTEGHLQGYRSWLLGLYSLLREASCCAGETGAFLTFLSGSGDVLKRTHRLGLWRPSYTEKAGLELQEVQATLGRAPGRVPLPERTQRSRSSRGSRC